MNKLKSPLFLWIILGAILLLLIVAAIFDRLAHSQAATIPQASAAVSSKVSSTTTPGEQPKVGWRIGDEAPDFELTTLANKDIKLSDYRGKNVILNFWASWCGPCEMEVPALKSAYDKLTKIGVVILAVSIKDTFENTQSYAKAKDLPWTIPVDPPGNLGARYNIHGIPTTYFINQKGIITSVKIGPFLSESEIMDRLSTFK
jgi:peroxiredoxin